MSARTDTTTDNLTATLTSALTIGTGDALVNSGAVLGSNRPSQLESAGGTSLPTYNRTQFQIGGAPIILNPNQPTAGYLRF
jgi:hypothetical protein